MDDKKSPAFFSGDDDDFEDNFEDEDEALDADDDDSYSGRSALRGGGLPGVRSPFSTGSMPPRSNPLGIGDDDDDDDDGGASSSFKKRDELARKLGSATDGNEKVAGEARFGSSGRFGINPPPGGSSGGATYSPSSSSSSSFSSPRPPASGGASYGSSSSSSTSSSSPSGGYRPPSSPTGGSSASYGSGSSSSSSSSSPSGGYRPPSSPTGGSSPSYGSGSGSSGSPASGGYRPPSAPASSASSSPSSPVPAKPADKGADKKDEGKKDEGKGGLMGRFGFGKKSDESDAKKDDKKDDKPASGLGSKIGLPFGKKADDKAEAGKPSPAKADAGDKGAGVGGMLGGLTSKISLPFGKKAEDDPKGSAKPAAKPATGDAETANKGGFFGGISSRLPFGGKKAEEEAKPPAKPSSPTGASSSAFSGGSSATSSATSTSSMPAVRSTSTSSMPAVSPAKPDAKTVKKDDKKDAGAGGFLSRVGGFFQRNQAPASAPSRPKTSKVPQMKDVSKDENGLTLDNWLDILGVGLLFGSFVVFFSAISPQQAAIGFIHQFFGELLGWGALAVPLGMFAIGLWLIVRHFGDKAPTIDPIRLIGVGMALACGLTLLQYAHALSYEGVTDLNLLRLRLDFAARIEHAGGGALGGGVYFFLVSNFTELGGFFVLVFFSAVASMLITRLSASDLMLYGYGVVRTVRMGLKARAARQRVQRQEAAKTREQKLRQIQAATSLNTADATLSSTVLASASASPAPPAFSPAPAPATSAEVALEDRIRLNRGGININSGAGAGTPDNTIPAFPSATGTSSAPSSPPPAPQTMRLGDLARTNKGELEALTQSVSVPASVAPSTPPAASDDKKRGFSLFGRGKKDAPPDADKPAESADKAPSTAQIAGAVAAGAAVGAVGGVLGMFRRNKDAPAPSSASPVPAPNASANAQTAGVSSAPSANPVLSAPASSPPAPVTAPSSPPTTPSLQGLSSPSAAPSPSSLNANPYGVRPMPPSVPSTSEGSAGMPPASRPPSSAFSAPAPNVPSRAAFSSAEDEDEDESLSAPLASFSRPSASTPASAKPSFSFRGDSAEDEDDADSDNSPFADLLKPPPASAFSRPASFADEDEDDALDEFDDEDTGSLFTPLRPNASKPASSFARPSSPASPPAPASSSPSGLSGAGTFRTSTSGMSSAPAGGQRAEGMPPAPAMPAASTSAQSAPSATGADSTSSPTSESRPEGDLASRSERLNAIRAGMTAPSVPASPMPAPSTPAPTPSAPASSAASAPLEGSIPRDTRAFGKPDDLVTHPTERLPFNAPTTPLSTQTPPPAVPPAPSYSASEIRPSQLPSVQPAGQAGEQQQPLSVPFSAPVVNQTRAQKATWKAPDYRGLLSAGSEQEADRQLLLRQAKIIEDTLESFGAPGRVVEINTGPVITQFGVEPDYIEARGGKKQRVKVGAIAGLDKDLQLSLGARSIRVEAPVPGKGYVGIEIPNPEPTTVRLRDVMDAPNFARHKSPLGIALGQSVSGAPISADLASMPHLLIAGTTGSGKSVMVNSIITSIIARNSPETVKFIMVDPKRVELTGYNGIPHLVAPVVVELERIVGVLKWVTREMDDRYRKFSQAGARNIEDYNKHLEPDAERLPYIVVLIDELADLMMLAPEETERTITRIAALARATGIHLVIATQRPSVDVVTGLIKANFPARIAFAVASSVDSRVILDQPGAERLLGRGDMLYLSGDSPAPLRLQGVYVSDMEISNIVRYWKTQAVGQPSAPPISIPSFSAEASGSPAPAPRAPGVPSSASAASTGGRQTALWDEQRAASAPSVPRMPSSMDDEEAPVNGATGEGASDDELYATAVEMVRRLEKASVSLLQRRLRIGYTRAARLIDMMEARGVVGPAKDGSSKPRDVLPQK